MNSPLVNQSDENNIVRRQFLKYALGLSVVATLGGVLIPILGYLRPTTRQGSEHGGRTRIASLAELQASGGLVVPAEGKPVIVTYGQRGDVKAFSAVCTHLGCVVKWVNAGSYIQCPCHDARFNAQTGAVISGPAPTGLAPRDVAIDGDDIYVVM